MGITTGNRVRELRATLFRGAVTQKELAERAGIDPSTLSDIENQRALPSIETALALARVLGVSVEDLFLPAAVAASATDSPPGVTGTAPQEPDNRTARSASSDAAEALSEPEGAEDVDNSATGARR